MQYTIEYINTYLTKYQPQRSEGLYTYYYNIIMVIELQMGALVEVQLTVPGTPEQQSIL